MLAIRLKRQKRCAGRWLHSVTIASELVAEAEADWNRNRAVGVDARVGEKIRQ
jgi:hypothetical protein